MFEFMFFDEDLRRQFVSFARSQGVRCDEAEDNMGLVAAIPEDIPDSISDQLDSYYDDLMEQQAERVDQADGAATHQAAGIRVSLRDGRSCMIRLDPKLANQLLAAFTLEEVQTLVQVIASNVENPGDGPICKR
jgi:hypothetical protein